MTQLNLQDYLELTKAVIYSLGGPAFIILGLSAFFGKYISKNKLENLKSKHKKEVEKTKDELERAKSQFIRYSEKQFDLYNSLWKVLIRTKMLADSLWEEALPEKLPGFSEQIKQTRRAVMDNMLLIEEEHYKKLDNLIGDFEKFKFGKIKLIDIRNADEGQTPAQVADTIKGNKSVKEKYNKLIMEIGKSLREQIRG